MMRVLFEKGKLCKSFFSMQQSFVLFSMAALLLYLTNQFYMLGQINKLLEMTNSTVLLASVLMVMVIPRLIILPLAGILTDKYNERTLMFVGFMGLTLLLGSMGVIEQRGLLSLQVLMIYAGAFGGISAVILPSTFSIIPKIVHHNHLPKANAAIQLINQLTVFIGPAIAGILLGFIQLKFYYAVLSCMMCLSGILIYLCKFMKLDNATDNVEQMEKPQQTEKGMKGYKVIFSTPILILLLSFTAILNLGVAGPQQIGLPILIDKELNLGTRELGYLLSVLGLGSIVGSALIGFFSKRLNLLCSLAILGIVFSLLWTFIVRPEHFIIICVLLALSGIAIGSINVMFITLLQLHSPEGVLGKVMSIQLMGSVGLQPLSFLISGILIDMYSLQTAFLLGGCSIFIISLMLLFMFVKGKKAIKKGNEEKRLTDFSKQC